MTKAEKRRFLFEMALTGNLVLACVAADVDSTEAIANRNLDARFERDWRAAAARAAAAAEQRRHMMR